MELKNYFKENCVSVWSNSKSHGQLIACASKNNKSDSLSDLQILSVDLADPAKTLKVEGKSLYNSAYRCLAWGTYGEKQGTLPYGLIFGGMQNGSFTLWNPAQIIGVYDDIHENQIDDQNAFLYAEEPDDESYPILCAQWNALKTNYLAYGSTSLLILDVSKDVSNPDILKPSSNNPHEGSYITSVTWNKQVPHILASAGSDGLIALYDIKTNRSIFSFRDNSSNNNTRQVEIAWSKQISTQIAVTLDDEKKNELQIWDLRNQKGPIVVIDKGHSRGINTMDWSQIDHDLILTASRDSRISCWNYKQDQQPLNSRKISSQITKISWAKNLPSIYSVTTTDGISLFSLDDGNIHSYIPKWLKVPASSTFNGNENVIVYSEEKGKNLVEYAIKPTIKKELSEEIAILQEFLENENTEVLKDSEGDSGDFWKLISTKKNQQSDSDIFDFLGLNKQKIIKQVQKYTGKKRQTFVSNEKSSKKQKTKSSKADYIPVPVTEAVNFFGSLSSEPVQKSFARNNDDQNEPQNVKYDMVPRNSNWDIGKQRLIKQNLLIGNYEGAIDAALKSGRTAQALIVAYSIDQNTFNNTLKTFCTETTDKFISGILRHIAFKDTQELVNRYDLDKWKQCVALIFSLSSSDKRRNLLTLLGNRLESEEPEHQDAAIYCFILAEQFQKIIQIYLQRLNKERVGTRARKITTVSIGTRLLAIYSSLTVTVKITAEFERLIRELALVCLQSNKKLLSYNLLTKYIPSSSEKYINYLIHNTQQLSSLKSQNQIVVNLPIMNKRQEKQKKNTKNNQPEQVPTNTKANTKQPKIPKTIAFQDDDGQDRNNKKKGSTVTIPGSYNRQPQPVVEQKKSIPPPPPPKKTQAFQNQQDHEQQQKKVLPPQPPKKGPVNVPPPPPVTLKKNLNTSSEQQPPIKSIPPQNPNKQTITQAPRQQNIRPPPPPPPHQVTTAKQPNTAIKSSTHQTSPPPPPPTKLNIKREEAQEKQEQVPSKKFAPPPSKLNNNPPVQQRIPPPPAKVTQRQEEQQDSQDQQQPLHDDYPPQQKQKTQTAQYNPPPQPKKTMTPPPPPPPPKTVTQTNQQQQNEENAQNFQTKKVVPPPPVKKGIPPPPPRR